MLIPRITFVSLCLASMPALAQDLDLGGIEDSPRILDWSLKVQPRAWFGAASGDLILPGGAGEVTFDSLDLDESALRPVLELDYRKDRWRVTITGFYLDEDGSATASLGGSLGGVAFLPGDRLASSLQYLSIEALGSYELWAYAGGERDGRPDLEASVDIVGGLRFTSLDIDFAASRGADALGSSSVSELFAEPVVGARLRLGLLRELVMETELNVGGFSTGGDQSSSSLDISSQLAYRPTEHLGVLFGYRQLWSSFEDGSGSSAFEYTGATAGLYFGIELRY